MKPKNEWSVGEHLQRALYESGMSHKAFLEATEMNRKTLQRLMSNETLGNIETWLKISSVLGMPISKILQRELWEEEIEREVARRVESRR